MNCTKCGIEIPITEKPYYVPEIFGSSNVIRVCKECKEIVKTLHEKIKILKKNIGEKL